MRRHTHFMRLLFALVITPYLCFANYFLPNLQEQIYPALPCNTLYAPMQKRPIDVIDKDKAVNNQQINAPEKVCFSSIDTALETYHIKTTPSQSLSEFFDIQLKQSQNALSYTVSLQPKKGLSWESQPGNFLFAIDSESIKDLNDYEHVKKALYQAIDQLGENDAFNIIFSVQGVKPFANGFVKASAFHKTAAKKFLHTLPLSFFRKPKDFFSLISCFIQEMRIQNTCYLIVISDGSFLQKKRQEKEFLLPTSCLMYAIATKKHPFANRLKQFSKKHKGLISYANTQASLGRKLQKAVFDLKKIIAYDLTTAVVTQQEQKIIFLDNSSSSFLFSHKPFQITLSHPLFSSELVVEGKGNHKTVVIQKCIPHL